MNSNTAIIRAILGKGVPEPQDILYILTLQKLSTSALAEELGMSRGNVTNVIYGHYASLPVAEHIAYRTGLSVRSLWGDRYDHLIARRNKKEQGRKAA